MEEVPTLTALLLDNFAVSGLMECGEAIISYDIQSFQHVQHYALINTVMITLTVICSTALYTQSGRFTNTASKLLV